MCIIDTDTCDIWTEKRPRARKRHECCECGGPIPVGCTHVRIDSLYDGSWESDRMHVECRALWTFMIEDVCKGKSVIQVNALVEEMRNHEELLPVDEDGEVIRPTFEDVLDAVREAYEAMETT